MPALRDQVVESTLACVKVTYLDRETSKWWNARKKADDTVTFCGWYWMKGNEEAGPFKTRSSALRDAYYRFVLEREVPSVARATLPAYQRKMKVRQHSHSAHA